MLTAVTACLAAAFVTSLNVMAGGRLVSPRTCLAIITPQRYEDRLPPYPWGMLRTNASAVLGTVAFLRLFFRRSPLETGPAKSRRRRLSGSQ
jgi:hypothetical protein